MKNPFENKNKHIRSNGPKPKTKRTIFAVLAVFFFSRVGSMMLEFNLLLDFFLGINKIRLLKTIIASINYKRYNIYSIKANHKNQGIINSF